MSEQLIQATILDKQTGETDIYYGIINPINDPFNLFIKLEQLLDDNLRYVYLFAYSMGKKNMIIWGLYDKWSDKFHIEDQCRWTMDYDIIFDRNYGMLDYMNVWKQNKYRFVGDLKNNQIKTTFAKYTHVTVGDIDSYDKYIMMRKLVIDINLLTYDEWRYISNIIALKYDVCDPEAELEPLNRCDTIEKQVEFNDALNRYITIVTEDLRKYTDDNNIYLVNNDTEYIEAKRYLRYLQQQLGKFDDIDIIREFDKSRYNEIIKEIRDSNIYILLNGDISSENIIKLEHDTNHYGDDINKLNVSNSLMDIQEVIQPLLVNFNKFLSSSKFNTETFYKTLDYCPKPSYCRCASINSKDCDEIIPDKECTAFYHGELPYYKSLYDRDIKIGDVIKITPYGFDPSFYIITSIQDNIVEAAYVKDKTIKLSLTYTEEKGFHIMNSSSDYKIDIIIQ